MGRRRTGPRDPGDGSLWQKLTSYDHLEKCYHKARRGKRLQPGVAAFDLDREKELWRLHEELTTRTYQPGPYRTFVVTDSKRRMISSTAFRHRVVHHALISMIEPIFEPKFIHDSYACRQDKGTHAAVKRFQHFARGFRYVLRLDIRKYFPSIDWQILIGLINHRVHDDNLRWLTRLIVESSNPQLPVPFYFPGDNLFTPHLRHRGIPVGNQTSQFFANVYLDPLDHYVKDDLGMKAYLRYVDDLAVFGDSKEDLWKIRQRVSRFLQALRLKLHAHKGGIHKTGETNTFLGYGIQPFRIRVARPSVLRFKRRLRDLQAGYARGEIDYNTIRQSVTGWVGHAQHANSLRLREALLHEAVFVREEGR